MTQKVIKASGLFIFLILILVSCPSPGNGGNGEGEGSISGTITDYYTKNPLSNVTISFGDTQVTSDNQGSYTIQFSSYDADKDIMQSFGVYKAGFQFYYVEEVTVNTDQDYTGDFSLKPTDLSEYTLREISGELFLSDASEFPDFGNITFYICYQDSWYSTSYQYWDDYTIYSPLFGDDCLILAFGDPADGTHDPCMFMETGVDLSSDAILDLTEPVPANLDTLALTLDQAGNSAKGLYDTPYGYVPVIARYTGSGDIVFAAEEINADNTPESIEIYNPQGWQYFWTQYETDDDFPEDVKKFSASGGLIDAAASVTLPVINQSFGPDEAADPASLTYNSPVLSQDPVSGAELFVYLFDDDLIDVNIIGMVIAAGESVTFPDWLVSALDTVQLDLHYTVESYNLTEYSIDFLGSRIHGIMFNTQNGVVSLDGDAYIQTIQF